MSADQLNTSHGSLDAFGDSKNKSIISIDAVRNAAEARQKVLSTVTNSAQCEQETRRNFLKLIERELVERNEKPIVLTALQTMHTITSNVLKNPDEVKFKTVKQSNRMIKKNVIDVPGARDYLLACKFIPGVKDHVETLSFPSKPTGRQLDILEIGNAILSQKMTEIQYAHETDMHMKQKEVDEEARRKLVTLDNIREDRERQKLRNVREKMARVAMERQANETRIVDYGDHDATRRDSF